MNFGVSRWRPPKRMDGRAGGSSQPGSGQAVTGVRGGFKRKQIRRGLRALDAG